MVLLCWSWEWALEHSVLYKQPSKNERKGVEQHANDACFSQLETRKQGVGREWRHRGCDSVEWCDLHGSGRPAVVSRVSCPPGDDRSGLYGSSIHQLCAGVGGEEDWVG